MDIGSFQPGDEAEVLAVWNRALARDPLTLARFRRMVLLDLNFDPAGLLVARRAGCVAGFLLALVRRHPLPGIGLQPELGWMTALAVDPPLQRQGIGTALLDAALAFFRERDRRRVLVSPYTPNYFFPGVDRDAYPGGMRLLEAAGFQAQVEVVGMSRPLLDFAVPGEIRALEERLAAAGTRVEFLDGDTVRPLLDFLDRDFPGDWPRVIRERLQGGVEWDEILVASRGGEVVGFCQFDGERFGPFGVTEAARGQRLGTLLFYRAVERMKAKGRRHLWLAWSGGEVQRFYERHGLNVDRRHAIMALELP